MRLLVLVSLFAFAACTPQPASYSPDIARNFTTACEAQGSSSALCGCVWDRIEAEISPGDFVALERLPGPERESHALTAQISGYVEACNASLTPLPAASEELVPAAP